MIVLQMFLLGDATTESLKTIAQYIGIPATMMFVAIYAVYKGWFTPANGVQAMRDAHSRECELYRTAILEKDKIIADKVTLAAEIKREAEERFERLRTEKDEWRNMALSTSTLATRATQTAKRALEAPPPPKDTNNE